MSKVIEDAFKQWWRDSYGLAPGPHAVMTHTAWAQHFVANIPRPSAEEIGRLADQASGGGEATLAEADQRLVELAIDWVSAAILTGADL